MLGNRRELYPRKINVDNSHLRQGDKVFKVIPGHHLHCSFTIKSIINNRFIIPDPDTIQIVRLDGNCPIVKKRPAIEDTVCFKTKLLENIKNETELINIDTVRKEIEYIDLSKIAKK